MGNKIIQTPEDLEKQLSEQLQFLQLSASAYDNGLISEAKRLAATLRILLHDTNNSHSLLGLLDKKNIKFLSTKVVLPEVKNNQMVAGSYSGLIGFFLGKGNGGYVPHLDSMSSKDIRYLNFNEYWNEIIFIDKLNINFSRKDIVLSIADQDGGAHVDPGLDERYHKLSRKNSLGTIAMSQNMTPTLVGGAELATVRQIAHEILRTMIPEYPLQKIHGDGIVIGGAGIILEFEPANKTQKDK